MALRPIFIKSNAQFLKANPSILESAGTTQFIMGGLFKVFVTKVQADGFWMRIEPGEYWTKEIQKEHGAKFAAFFDDVDVKEPLPPREASKKAKTTKAVTADSAAPAVASSAKLPDVTPSAPTVAVKELGPVPEVSVAGALALLDQVDDDDPFSK